MEYYRGAGIILNFSVSDLADLEFASSIGNQSEIPADYPVDKAYLEGFLNTLYTGIDDLKPGSKASQMRKLFGLSNPGSTSASMFCNRYSWEKSLELFGAINNMGAQAGK